MKVTPPTAGDLEQLAVLHRQCLPRSILSSLGPAAVAKYYAYLETSPSEQITVARGDDGAVQGGLVVSQAPETLLRRFALRAPAAIGLGLARGLVADRELRRRCLARLGERQGSALDIPEVVQIFTAPLHRGRGIGSQLLRSCEQSLRLAQSHAYCIHTNADDNEAGIRFYLREGFITVGETRSFGDRFLVMTKGLR